MERLKNIVCVLALLLAGGGIASGQGIITTIAGNGITQYIGDGAPATNYSLGGPQGICMDKTGNIYIANVYTSRISKLAHDTLSTTIGNGQTGYKGDGGLADTCELTNPVGICMDTAGNFFVTDIYYDVIRKVNTAGYISTVCGSGLGGFGGDGGPALLAHMETPHGACTDQKGNLYIADFGNNRVRKLTTATGIITTYAGNGTNGFSGDTLAATNAELSYPSAVCTDNQGNLYIAEFGNHRIRKVNVNTGIITTVAGNGSQAYTGDGGLAIQASLNEPNGVYVDKHGIMYISDFGNNVIRAVTAEGIMTTVAGNGSYGYSGDGGPAVNASFRGPTAVMADNAGYIYVADGDNSVIRKVSPINFANAGVKQSLETGVMLYPNPAPKGRFTVAVPDLLSVLDIQVMNALGTCVYQCEVSAAPVNIDISKSGPGIYFVQLTTADGRVVKKVLVQ